MKMFIEPKEQPKRSWSIVLNRAGDTEVTLDAVDSTSREYIGTVIKFSNNGEVYIFEGLYDRLLSNRYDPFEHKNTFDDDGVMVITKAWIPKAE